MDINRNRYVYAADELYSAVADAILCNKITERLREAKIDFATASNLWDKHPLKNHGNPDEDVMASQLKVALLRAIKIENELSSVLEEMLGM